MLATELVTAVQEHVKVIVVLVQNHGYASIGALSEELGSERFGTRYRYRGAIGSSSTAERLPVDLAANARVAGRARPARRARRRSSPRRCAQAKAADERRCRPRRDRPAGARPGLPRRGGTSRSPRCPRSRAPGALVRDLRPEQGHAAAVPAAVLHDRPRGDPVSSIHIGSAPDSWGVWFPDDAEQTTLAALPRRGRRRRLRRGSSSARTATSRPTPSASPTSCAPAACASRPARCSRTSTRARVLGPRGSQVARRGRPDACRRRRAPRRHPRAVARPTRPARCSRIRSSTTPAGRRLTAGHGHRLGHGVLEEYGLRVQFHSHADTHVGVPARHRALRQGRPTPATSTSASTPGTSPTTAATTSGSSAATRSGSATCTSSRSTRRPRAGRGRGPALRPDAVRVGAMVEPPHGIPTRCPRSWPRSRRPSCDQPRPRRDRRAGHVPVPARPAPADRAAHPHLPGLVRRRVRAHRPAGLTRSPEMDTDMIDELRVAVLGVGKMGSFHVESLSRRTHGARVTVVSDFADEAAHRVGDPIGARVRGRPGRGDRRGRRRRGRPRQPRRRPRGTGARLPRGRQAGAVREAADHRGRERRRGVPPRAPSSVADSSRSASCAASTTSTRPCGARSPAASWGRR